MGKLLKSAVLAERAPEALSEHVRLKTDKLDTFKKTEQCTVDYVVSKNTGTVPIDAGALMKGKGKGKDSRKGNKDMGKGKKGGKDKKGNDKANGRGDETARSTHFNGHCITCWKWSHKSKDCW